MIGSGSLFAVLESYLDKFPDERAEAQTLASLITGGAAAVWRDDFPDHATASGIILSTARPGHMLLIHHPFLDIWIQPGGHIEPGDASLAAAALREVREELILAEDDVEPHPAWPRGLPFDLARFDIPASPVRAEPPHAHWDFRFLFLTQRAEVPANLEEVSGSRWAAFEQAPDRLPGKLVALLGGG